MKRLISLAVSCLILGILYWRIDASDILTVLGSVDGCWLLLAVAIFVPVTLLGAARLHYMVRRKTEDIGYGDALALQFAASVMNLVLPSKMGDIAKAVFLKDHGHMGNATAFAIVVLEKANDVLALLLLCGVGLVLFPDKHLWFWVLTALIAASLLMGILMIYVRGFAELLFRILARLLPSRLEVAVGRLRDAWLDTFIYLDLRLRHQVVLFSMFIWLVHLTQIWLFILALNVDTVDFLASMGLSALAIFFGLLPFTFMGVGTRDAALIYLYAPYFPAAVGAALGVLTTLRYLLPALVGIPFFVRYLPALTVKPRS